MNKFVKIVSIFAFLMLFAVGTQAEVLGPCGTPDAQAPAKKAAGGAIEEEAGNQTAGVQRILMPGEQAPNFAVTALVGDKAKTIKLSDYDGKWRVVCFYPADFTFV